MQGVHQLQQGITKATVVNKWQLQCMGMQVYLKAGFPQLRRSGFLQILQSWLQRVGTTTDFQYMMLSAMFLPQQSVSLVCYTPAHCSWFNSHP